MSFVVWHTSANAADESIELDVTLQDELETRSQNVTFDVFAMINDIKADDKMVAVTNNGKDVPINWSDPSKTSYTVTLEEGLNELIVMIEYDDEVVKETRYIEYIPAAIGEIIGHYVFSMDAAVAGVGYLIEPTQQPIINGDNAAHHLKRALEGANFTFDYTGNLERGFYLGTVYGGNLEEKYDYVFPEAIVEAAYEHEFELNYNFNPEEGLGEFVFSGGSGWMYAINNSFPNVGFSEYYLLDGDVMRVQFTLNLGRDLGGGDPTFLGGSNFFPITSKDALTTGVAHVNSSLVKDELLQHDALQTAYADAKEMLLKINPTQLAIDSAAKALEEAMIAALNTLIEQQDPSLTFTLQEEMQRLQRNMRERMEALSLLHKDAHAFEQQVEALPETITTAHFLTVQNIRKLYEDMPEKARLFIHQRTVNQLLAAESKLLDVTLNNKPYKLFPSMAVTNRQHAFTVTLSDAVHAENVDESIIVRTSTSEVIPTEKIVDGHTVIVRPLQQSYRRNTTYTLSVTQQLQNDKHQALAQPVQMAFTVQ